MTDKIMIIGSTIVLIGSKTVLRLTFNNDKDIAEAFDGNITKKTILDYVLNEDNFL